MGHSEPPCQFLLSTWPLGEAGNALCTQRRCEAALSSGSLYGKARACCILSHLPGILLSILSR